MVTVLTRDAGVLRAFARRAKKINDAKSSGTQLLCYSRLNIYVGRDKYIINDAFPQEVFFGLRTDIIKLALGQYFCELAAELIPEEVDSSEYLRVILNALHFLSTDKRTADVLKPLVEMRLLSLAGYMPDLVCCKNCGKYEDESMHFITNSGVIYCDSCFVSSASPSIRLGTSALRGMRHIIYSDFDRLFAFSVKGEAGTELKAASESYLLSVIQKKPRTLSFYGTVCN